MSLIDNWSICLSTLWEIETPDFSEFLQTPNNPTCKLIDVTKLKINIIISWEKQENKSLLIDWNFAFVLKYKWDVAYILGFDFFENRVSINQLQWTKKRWYRINSSIKILDYFVKLIEDSFLKKWIKVEVNISAIKDFTNLLVDRKPWAINNYLVLERRISNLNKDYFTNM